MALCDREQYAERRDHNAPTVSDLMDWIAVDAHQRALCRSFGEVRLALVYQDGFLRAVKVEEGHHIHTGTDRLRHSAAARPGPAADKGGAT